MTFLAQRHTKIGAREALTGLAAIILWSAASTPVLSQEAEDDGPGPLTELNVDELTLSGTANEAASSTQPFRVGSIGAVDQGTSTDNGDPYAAEGLRLGSFVVRPTLEVGITGTRSVTNRDSGGPAGFVEDQTISFNSENSLGLLINSDWSRHFLELDLSGTLPVGISGDEDDPSLDARANLNLDLSALTSISLTGVYGYSTEDPQSAAYRAAIDAGAPSLRGINEPATQLYSGTVTVNHDFGGLTAQISAAIARLEYGAAKLSDGTSVSQADLNSTDYNISFRGGYALSGVLSPFVELRYGKRLTDELLDSGGFNRNATNYQLRLGTEIDFAEKLSGEIGVGYGVEKYDDASLPDVSGVVADLEFNWSPQRGTDVTLSASTEFVPSGTEDVSGSLLYATELGLSHRLTSQLTGTAAFGVAYEAFEGPSANETTLNGSLGMIYNLNRYLALTSRIGHEQTFSSSESARESSSNIFVGMRLQR